MIAIIQQEDGLEFAFTYQLPKKKEKEKEKQFRSVTTWERIQYFARLLFADMPTTIYTNINEMLISYMPSHVFNPKTCSKICIHFSPFNICIRLDMDCSHTSPFYTSRQLAMPSLIRLHHHICGSVFVSTNGD